MLFSFHSICATRVLYIIRLNLEKWTPPNNDQIFQICLTSQILLFILKPFWQIYSQLELIYFFNLLNNTYSYPIPKVHQITTKYFKYTYLHKYHCSFWSHVDRCNYQFYRHNHVGSDGYCMVYNLPSHILLFILKPCWQMQLSLFSPQSCEQWWFLHSVELTFTYIVVHFEAMSTDAITSVFITTMWAVVVLT